MIEESENFDCSCKLCSLCNCCEAENAYISDWDCDDKTAIPFIRANVFYEGKCLCRTGCNTDCVYRYMGDKVIAIEIKDQPLKNIDYDNLVAKIKNCYVCAEAKKFTIVAFVLQLSSIKNSSKRKFQLLKECEDGLNANNLRIGKGKLFSKESDFKNMKIKFDIVKCKELDEKYFRELLV